MGAGRIYGRMCGCSSLQIEEDVKLAIADKAPADAYAHCWDGKDFVTYKRHWSTIDELAAKCSPLSWYRELLEKFSKYDENWTLIYDDGEKRRPPNIARDGHPRFKPQKLWGERK